MKAMFSSLVVLFVVLVFSQTASAIPMLAVEADSSTFDTQSITNRYTVSRLHEMFISGERDIELTTNQYNGSRWQSTLISRWRARLESSRFGERYTGADVPLSDAGDLLGSDPITVTTVDECCDFFELDDVDYERGDVKVPEPTLAALIALGLVGFGLARRMKH